MKSFGIDIFSGVIGGSIARELLKIKDKHEIANEKHPWKKTFLIVRSKNKRLKNRDHLEWAFWFYFMMGHQEQLASGKYDDSLQRIKQFNGATVTRQSALKIIEEALQSRFHPDVILREEMDYREILDTQIRLIEALDDISIDEYISVISTPAGPYHYWKGEKKIPGVLALSLPYTLL